MCCTLLARPVLFDEAFATLRSSDEKVIHFLSVLPVYREEMDFKLSRGADSLFELLGRADVSELLNLNRTNVCRRKRFGWF
jgi:hypothetical protein